MGPEKPSTVGMGPAHETLPLRLPFSVSTTGFNDMENVVVCFGPGIFVFSSQAMLEKMPGIEKHATVMRTRNEWTRFCFVTLAALDFSLEFAMPATIARGYRVHHVSESPTVPCSCGESTRVLTRPDGLACNFHVTFIQDSVKHYHKECTEVYYILEGKGNMELNGDTIAVQPGMVIYIEPNTKHRLWSEKGVRTIVLGIPAWNPEDEYYDC